jgi:S1-C subfamily serine protease
MKQLRAAAWALGAVVAGGVLAAPALKAGGGERLEIVRRLGGVWLGVGLEDTSGAERGARVRKVVKDSPAEKAGLKEGDVVVRFDGEAVRSAAQLARLVSETPEGRAVAIEVRRDGATQKLEATLAEGRRARLLDMADLHKLMPEPPEPPDAPLAPEPPALPDFDFRWHGDDHGPLAYWGGGPRKLGIRYQAIEGQLASYFKAPGEQALLVTSVDEDSPAAKAGLKAGDVIVKLGDRPIEDGRDLRRALERAEPGEQVVVQVLREGRSLDLKVTLAGERKESKRSAESET